MMTRNALRRRLVLSITTALIAAGSALAAGNLTLELGWDNPPASSRLRAYWWWLNGNVTKAAITRDLEEMKNMGWGGALICDADGASQDGNDRVRHGPDFLSPEWRQLFKHALREADRLGLEMSLNIQSGWNLGGPPVTADDAAKKLVWSEVVVQGPTNLSLKLPEPRRRDGYYRDLFVVAYPMRSSGSAANEFMGVTTSAGQSGRQPSLMLDGDIDTFWVSAGTEAGQAPTRERPAWVQFDFAKPVAVNRLILQPRSGYGPRECEVEVSDDGKTFRSLKEFSASQNDATRVEFDAVTGRAFRLRVCSSFDPRFPQRPRNVQIAELALSGPEGAWPTAASRRRPIQNWEEKAVYRALHFSAPDTTPLLVDVPAEPGEEDTDQARVVDVTARLDEDGTLRWDVPQGAWQVLRFGCTIGDHSRVSTSSDGWKGYALDVLDAGAFGRYWNAVVEPLIADAGPLAGRTLKYLHTDSWEVEAINWTSTLREEFLKRRGYDMLPFLPVLAGRIVDSRPVSNRFLHDLRRTLGDLAIDNHYRPFRDGAHRHGLQIHPESGGPHAVPVDAQQCLEFNDVPMSEFWAWSWRHRVGDSNRFFCKQPASAAHTYGRRFVAAEGFTTIGPHWQETVWDNLKPAFDKALCEGMNLLFWHAFVCSPEEEGMPGIQYFAGTHFNPNSTWWAKSGPFIAYINRCQWMLQQGLFVADACYYYGDHVPNFSQLKMSDPAKVLPGHDYDVITADALLTRATVRDRRIVLPDGMSYRVLVLPVRAAISLAVLRKVKELVEAGAKVAAARPAVATGLTGFPQSDAEVSRLANELWGPVTEVGVNEHRFGRGRVVSGKTAREVLLADGVKPDFEFTAERADAMLDFIHRRDGDAEIYFVANRSNRWESARCTFRVSAKAPELWDAVSGQRRFAPAYQEMDGRITLQLDFAPCGSWFVVFRQPAKIHPATAQNNSPQFESWGELDGPWTVQFDPKWGGPASVQFAELTSWPQRSESGIKFYSGTATYTKTFDLPPALRDSAGPLWLDLGNLRELAEVRLNGKSLGILWTPPFRVDITDVVKATGNQLEVDVVSFWPNRIIGDQSLPENERRTRTNVRKLTKDTPLMESGLLGPVRLMSSK